MNSLSIIKQYPTGKYNLLGNTDVIVEIPEIKKPVIQAIKLSPDPGDGDVYKLQGKFAISKNGLRKLADGAGIRMISSEHVLPASCQKCAAVNAHTNKVIQCGTCQNKDVAFRVTIGVPQLTGEILTVDDTNEIIVSEATASMSPAQKKEFMKFLPQICEAKALNGAIRTALHIKGTYTGEELSRPFVVAYLIPNLDHEEVKHAAIASMFESSGALYGKAPSVQQIESSVPEQEPASIEAADGEVFDEYVDGTYTEAVEPVEPVEPAAIPDVRRQDYYCDRCGEQISRKVWEYSLKYLERPLCYKCQQDAKQRGGAGR